MKQYKCFKCKKDIGFNTMASIDIFVCEKCTKKVRDNNSVYEYDYNEKKSINPPKDTVKYDHEKRGYVCKQCKEIKPKEYFQKEKNMGGGYMKKYLSSRCKECRNEVV